MAKNRPVSADDFVLGNLQRRGTRRLIYNSDPSNTTSHLSDPAAQPKELRQIVRNYANEGNIDTLVQEIFAEAMTMFWRTDKCAYDVRYQHRRLVPMMDNGLMPVEVYIDECHKQGMEFIAGFRMNDRHGQHSDFFEMLSRERPEWVLKEYAPSWKGAPPESHQYGCALNYAIDGVRDWLFSIIEEAANRFDIDGIEFNFTRLAECFPSDEAADSHPIMTGFVRRVRKMLDEAVENRVAPTAIGRRGDGYVDRAADKLILGVRVPQKLEGCAKWGLDVRTWTMEGLVDYVAPSDFGFTDFNERYEDFVRLARAHDCYVYPQITEKVEYNTDFEMAPARNRAAVCNFYAAGGDGFSTQNYFLHWVPKFAVPGEDGPDPVKYPSVLNHLTELGSPETIAASGDRHYVFLPIWGDRNPGPGGIYVKEEIVLARGNPNERGDFRFRVCEDFPADPIPLTDEGSGLTFIAVGLEEGDELAVDINGTPIAPEQMRWTWHEDEGRPPTCKIALSSPPFVYGDNHLGLRIVKSAEGAEGHVKVGRVECMVRASRE